MIKHVRHHILKDIKGKGIRIDEQGEHSQEFKDSYVAFTCLLANPNDGLLYCGVTAFNTDIAHKGRTVTRAERASAPLFSFRPAPRWIAGL